jgi:hypothetical protein
MSDILEAIKNGNLIFMRATHSVAVVNHIFSARRHWSWAEREKTTKEGGATTRDVQLQLKVATIFEREGGPPTDVTSTAALQCMFGVDDVRSGTVLLRDLNSATFHLQTAAEAFADLGKLLGVDHGNVASYRTRPWHSAPAVAVMLNGAVKPGLTTKPCSASSNSPKKRGGGALVHDSFAGFNNMVSASKGGGAASADKYASRDTKLLHEGHLCEPCA